MDDYLLTRRRTHLGSLNLHIHYHRPGTEGQPQLEGRKETLKGPVEEGPALVHIVALQGQGRGYTPLLLHYFPQVKCCCSVFV